MPWKANADKSSICFPEENHPPDSTGDEAWAGAQSEASHRLIPKRMATERRA